MLTFRLCMLHKAISLRTTILRERKIENETIAVYFEILIIAQFSREIDGYQSNVNDKHIKTKY